MKTRVSVSYTVGDTNAELDKLIANALEKVGFIWYAQGFDLITNRRDLAFDAPDLPEPTQKSKPLLNSRKAGVMEQG